MARKKSRKKDNVTTIDLSGVESARKAIPEGNYIVSVNDASIENSSKGSDYIKFEFEVIEGPHKGTKLFHNCSLQPQALFNLKGVLEALGFTIPSKAFDLDLSELLGLECEVEVGHETYEGKKRARILEFISGAEDEEDDDEDDEDDEDEDGEDEDGDEELDLQEALEELSKKDLRSLAKEFEVKVSKDDDKEDIIEALIEEVDEDDLEEAIEDLS